MMRECYAWVGNNAMYMDVGTFMYNVWQSLACAMILENVYSLSLIKCEHIWNRTMLMLLCRSFIKMGYSPSSSHQK